MNSRRSAVIFFSFLFAIDAGVAGVFAAIGI